MVWVKANWQLRHNVLGQSALLLALNWFLAPLSFLTGAVVARAVGPEGKGVLFLLSGLLGVLSSLFGLGLPTAAAYFYKQGRWSLGQIMSVCLLLAGLSMVAAVILFMSLSGLFIRVFVGHTENIVVQPVWIWLTLATFSLTLVAAPGEVLLIVDGAMKLYTIQKLGYGFLSIALTWLLALALAWGVTGVLLSQLLAAVLPIGVVIYWMIRKRSQTRFDLKLGTVKSMLAVGLQQYGISLVAMVAKRFDAFLISGLLSVREAGYFSIAYLLFNVLTDVPRVTMWPMVARLTGNTRPDRHRVLAMATRIQLALMALMALVVGILAPWLIQIFYGDAFLPAVVAVWGFLPAFLMVPIIVSGNAYLTSRGVPGKIIPATIVATVAQVIISSALVPRIGILGSALGFATGQAVVAVWVVLWLVQFERLPLGNLLFISRGDLGQIIGYGIELRQRMRVLVHDGFSRRGTV